MSTRSQGQNRPLQLSSTLLSGSSGGGTSGAGPSASSGGGNARSSGLVQQFALYNSSGAGGASSSSSSSAAASSGHRGSRGHHHGHHGGHHHHGSSSSGSGGGSGAGAGVSEQQASSGLVLNAQQQTNPSPQARALGPARLKLDELYRYWSQLPETAATIDTIVREALSQLNTHSSSSSSAAALDRSGASAAGADAEGPSPASTAPVPQSSDPVVITDDDSDGEFELPEEQGAAARPAMAEPGESPRRPAAANGGGAGGGSAASVVASPPAGIGNNPRGTAKDARAGGNVPNVAVSMDDLPDLGGFSLGGSAEPSPSAPTIGGSSPGAKQPQPTSETGTPSKGGVSPRSQHTPPTRTPREANARHLGVHGSGGMLADEMDVAHRYGALSPRALSPAAMASFEGAPAKSPLETMLRSPRLPQAAGMQLDAPAVPKSRSPSPQPLSGNPFQSSQPLTGDDSDREGTPRLHGRRRSVSSLGSSMSEVPAIHKVPVATTSDIPRFYFARGRQSNQPECLSDEVGGTRASSSKEAQTRARQAEEKEVQAMTKFVNQASPSAASGGKRLANGRAASAKKGANSAEALQNAVRGLTIDAFGLPRVLAPVVASKVIKQPGNSLTLANVRTFYDTCIVRNSRPRRIFETLLGSSPQAPAIERGNMGQRRNYLVREDLLLLMTSLVEHHPGLSFLKEAADFQSKYIETVILRIFYELDPRDTGRITWDAFFASELHDAIQQLADTDEINQVLAYFSYEHFYVLYCRFWELDSDKDLLINAGDFERYFPEQTANDLVVQRIFSGSGRKLQCKVRDKMGYDDFVYFCIAEEDKASPRALRYWFRILDTDGDGILSGYELATFYEITRKRLEQLTGEAIAFPDVMCQIADMLVGPAHDGTAPPSPTAGNPPLSPGMPGSKLSSSPATPLTGFDLMAKVGSSSKGASPMAGSSSAAPILGSSKPVLASGSKPPRETKASRKGTPVSQTLQPHGAAAGSSSAVDPMSIGFTLADLLHRPLAAAVAITMITNVSKFLTFEQRDPFVVHHERATGGPERNDWDRFCRAEYDRMSLSEEDG